MDNRTGRTLQCPLCASEAKFWGALPETVFDCAVCGRFKMTFELTADRDMESQVHPYLSAATRKAHESGRTLTLDMNNWQELEDEQRSIRVSEKLIQLLRLIAERSGAPGHEWNLVITRDYTLIAARDAAELESYISHLNKRGFLGRSEAPGHADGTFKIQLTIPGWQELEPMPLPGGVPGRCFVAMSFDPSLDSAYEIGIKPAIQECGFSSVCMKEIATNEGITGRILSEIRLAQFVVADFTGQRGGVYFEAGFARGLGREVIWACRKDELKLVHFDIKHFGHVVWEDVADLRTKLAESVRANIIPKR